MIQPGDTLSSIAAKYLGSSARYREIYEANRQVLRSPDDLPDGVTITIPEKAAPAPPNAPVAGHGAGDAGAVPKTRQTSARSANSLPPETLLPSANTGEAAAPSGGLRFAPVRRNPFSAGRTAGGARPATERSVPQPAATERNEREVPPVRREVKSREMPASPPAKASPSKARLELDDSDPFDAPQ